MWGLPSGFWGTVDFSFVKWGIWGYSPDAQGAESPNSPLIFPPDWRLRSLSSLLHEYETRLENIHLKGPLLWMPMSQPRLALQLCQAPHKKECPFLLLNVYVLSHSVVSDSVTPWIVVGQAPLSMGFSREECCRGCHSLPQGTFPTQQWNLHLLHWQTDSLPLSHLGSPSAPQNGPRTSYWQKLGLSEKVLSPLQSWALICPPPAMTLVP